MKTVSKNEMSPKDSQQLKAIQFDLCLFSESGRLEFVEFVQLAAKFIVEEDSEAMAKELKEAFRLYDKEGNGYIPTSCLKEILRELDDQLTNTELDGMIEEIDSDGSGTVDFDGKPIPLLSTPIQIPSRSIVFPWTFFIPISEFMEMMTGE